MLRSSSSVNVSRIPSGLSGPRTKQVLRGILRLLVSWPCALPVMQRILPDAASSSVFYDTTLKCPPSFAQTRKKGGGWGNLAKRGANPDGFFSAEFFFDCESCIHIGFGFALKEWTL